MFPSGRSPRISGKDLCPPAGERSERPVGGHPRHGAAWPQPGWPPRTVNEAASWVLGAKSSARVTARCHRRVGCDLCGTYSLRTVCDEWRQGWTDYASLAGEELSAIRRQDTCCGGYG